MPGLTNHTNVQADTDISGLAALFVGVTNFLEATTKRLHQILTQLAIMTGQELDSDDVLEGLDDYT